MKRLSKSSRSTNKDMHVAATYRTKADELQEKWNKRLAKEGLPKEVPPIPNSVSIPLNADAADKLVGAVASTS
jgi:hypothetical protein